MNGNTAIRVEAKGAIAVLSLAQPDRGNPVDGEFARDLRAAALDLWNRCDPGSVTSVGGMAASPSGTDSDSARVRAVLVRADGPNFSVGGDLKQFAPQRERLGPLVRAWTADLNVGLQRLWTLPVPVVCAVQGFAMGGSVSLVAGCDVVLATPGSRFGSAFTHLGFSCDCGSSVTLSARMGAARARRFVMLGEQIDGAAAHQAGLADQLVPEEQLEQEALRLAQSLAAGPTLAYGEIKRLFLLSGGTQLQARLEDEAFTLARIAGTADAQEGIAAMTERRRPRFEGN